MSQKLKVKKDKNDPTRFEGEGVNFRAKLIGIDDVESARGDKMCQDSLQKLKAAVKASGEHKQRIIVNVSLEGLTLIDEKTKAIDQNHAVHRISFISRDVTDNRAFGYIYGTGDGTHKFFAIKTLQAAEMLVLTLRDLFQCVYELKKQEITDVKNKQEGGENSETTEVGQNEAGESIYQVPTNGAPVEGKEGESIYQVPGSNEPVKTDEPDNLVDLENELQSLQAGIQQIDTFEDIFSVRQSGDGAVDAVKSDPWGTSTPATNSSAFGDSFGAVSSTTTTSSSNDLFDTAFSTPASNFGGVSSATTTSSSNDLFDTAFSTPASTQSSTAVADPFSNQMSQLGISTTTSSPFSLQAPPNAQRSSSPFAQRSSSPFAQTMVNPMTGFGAPQMQAGFGQTPFGAVGVTPAGNQSLFGGPPPTTQQTPFGNPMAGGMFGAPVNPAMGFNPRQQAPANPFGSGGFSTPAQAPPMQAANMFDAPVMMPTGGNTSVSPQEAEAKPRSGSDLFGDLVGIGPTERKGKTPKQLFDEQKTEPKKSLNQLKPVPTAATAQNPNASPFGDSFSIFGAPLPTTDPLYATVNKTNPPDAFDLL